MSILVNKSTRVIIQGISGREGSSQARNMAEYGTNIVAGVTPGKGGSWVMDEKIPVFDSMQTAVEVTEANASVVFVPPRQACDALYEAANSGVELVVCTTEGIPVHDVVNVCRYMETKGVRLIGPNCAGILTPGEQILGIFPNNCAIPGNVGIITRSGTVSYMIMDFMKNNGIGVSTCLGIGGDLISGTSFVEAMELFENDPYTEKILLIGEVGVLEEERAAKYATYKMSKPVCAFVSGMCAPSGKRMGHSGAYTEGGIGSVAAKLEAFEKAGIRATSNLPDVIDLIR